MFRVPQKINNIVEIFSYNGCRLQTLNVRGGGVVSMRTDADKGERGGQKLAKSCGPLIENIIYCKKKCFSFS